MRSNKAEYICAGQPATLNFSLATKRRTIHSSLTILVVGPLGAVIAKAFVLLHSDALERENPKPFSLELRTGSEGEAKGELPSGFYDLFVASTGLAPHCQKLRARDGKPVTLKIVLKLDKLACDQYCDEFNQ